MMQCDDLCLMFAYVNLDENYLQIIIYLDVSNVECANIECGLPCYLRNY